MRSGLSDGRRYLFYEIRNMDLVFFGHIEELIAELVVLAIGNAPYPGDFGDGFDRLTGIRYRYLYDHPACKRYKLFRFEADPALAYIFG